MSDSGWAPGWYRNAAGNTQYWDGTGWVSGTEQLPAASSPAPPGAYVPPNYQPAYEQNNGMAVAALVLGLLGLLLGFLASVPGIVVGHIARRRARDMGGVGKDMALVGLILSYVVTVLTALAVLLIFAILIPILSNPQLQTSTGDTLLDGVTEISVELNLRQAGTAQELYQAEFGRYTKDVSALGQFGYTPIPGGGELGIPSATTDSYCLEATTSDGTVYHKTRATGAQPGPCPMAG